MNEPTQGQIKEFWEWCGLSQNHWTQQWFIDQNTKADPQPILDLNNLFKYAVPFLLAGDRYSIKIYTHKGNNEVTILAHYMEDKGSYAGSPDLALALFWAIYPLVVAGKGGE